MTALALEHPAGSAGTTVQAFLARRGVLVAAAIAWALVAVGVGLLIATSDHLVDPIAFGLQRALIVVGWSSAALYWLVRRPGNRLGLALLALAVSTALIGLQGASNPLLYSMGVLDDFPAFLLAYYVVFAFPEGRLARWPERLVLGGFALWFLTSFFPRFFFSPVVTGGSPLSRCNAACPTNPFMIADRPTIADGFGFYSSYLVIGVATAAIALLFYRLATETRPRRRALIPVYLPAVMLTAPVLIFHGVATNHLDLAPNTIWDVGWFLTVGRTLLPYGFLLSIVVSTFFAATALKRIVIRLVEDPSAAELRTTLAAALDDPSLEIGFRLEEVDGFVDSDGNSFEYALKAGQASMPVFRNGETVAVLMYDAGLDADPELVAAAGHALVLALENGRLTTELNSTNAELQSTTKELRATRARIVAKGDAERRKFERDLHDGAQQHLVALRIRLGLAREIAGPEVAARLDDVGNELEEILEELRDVAHGLHPPLLRAFGLRDALASAVRRSATPTTLEAAAIGRFSQDIEATVFFCCVESLQNVDKHAGSGASAVVRLWERDGRLYFEVVDDGVGYDVESARGAGQGLANVWDRVAALGGNIDIRSTPGGGSTTRADIPISSARMRV